MLGIGCGWVETFSLRRHLNSFSVEDLSILLSIGCGGVDIFFIKTSFL